jgi:hypothetical protein
MCLFLCIGSVDEKCEGQGFSCDREEWDCIHVNLASWIIMKNGVFWDITPCGSYKNRRFRGT